MLVGFKEGKVMRNGVWEDFFPGAVAKGVCGGAAETPEKIVDIPGYTLAEGDVLAIKYTHGINSGANVSVNVNGSGKKPVRLAGRSVSGEKGGAAYCESGGTVMYLYSGGFFNMFGSGGAAEARPNQAAPFSTLSQAGVSAAIAGKLIQMTFTGASYPMIYCNTESGRAKAVKWDGSVTAPASRGMGYIALNDLAYWGGMEAPYNSAFPKFVAVGSCGENGDFDGGGLLSFSVAAGKATSIHLGGCEGLLSLDMAYNALQELDASESPSLESLDCGGNHIKDLALPAPSALKRLVCQGNLISTLDISRLGSLEYLDCWNNQIEALDASGCASLTGLGCNGNKLAELRLPAGITSLDCGDNQLAELDLSGARELAILNCDNNLIKTLDASGCAPLTELRCKGNKLAELRLPAGTVILDCRDNHLAELDLSDARELVILNCCGNLLESLHLARMFFSVDSINMRHNRLASLTVDEFGMDSFIDAGILLDGNLLEAAALDDFFEALPQLQQGAVKIHIYGNPGTFTCDPQIASGKGYNVYLYEPTDD
jgi:hypothetical protein